MFLESRGSSQVAGYTFAVEQFIMFMLMIMFYVYVYGYEIDS